MKTLGIPTLRLPVTILALSSLTLLVSPPVAHSQSPVNASIFDPGPRNPGSANATFCVPPGIAGAKFSKNNMGVSNGTNCVDVAQPPTESGVTPAADGAGNVIGSTFAPPVGTNPLTGLWFDGLVTFSTIASVTGGAQFEPLIGLGPSFNAQGCFQCHMVPAVGGTSPGTVTIQTSATKTTSFSMPISGTLAPLSPTNPELLAESDDGATNQTPDFNSPFSLPGVTTPGFPTVEVDGPVIEVRFVQALAQSGNVAAVGANGVGNLFTIEGRGDLPTGCSISQIPFSGLPSGSISFRIPTPTFGLGLVESTPDPILIENSLAVTSGNTLGVVGGVFNTSGNDGSITRFGWKAQNKSLLIFAGEAENVEMGVTNELFPNERTWGATPVATAASTGISLTVPPCINNPGNPNGGQGYPEDEILGTGGVALASSNAEEDSIFMLMNAAPSQCSSKDAGTFGGGTAVCDPLTAGEKDGLTQFKAAGCNLCHTQTLITGPSPNASLSSVSYQPFSDFALHHMGGLSDGISQGTAAGDQFRTAPLWGIGQRLFFMHDGRATDLRSAIADHCIATTSTTVSGSEACGSVSAFNGLTNGQQQEILDFLRSL